MDLKDGSASRIYVTDLDDNSFFVTLKSTNGNDYDGHLGGIAVNNDIVYISCSDKIHILDLIEIVLAKLFSQLHPTSKLPCATMLL